MHRLAFGFALVIVAACGGKAKTGTVEHVDTVGHDGHEAHESHEGEHPGMPPALAEFHEHLSPLWHAAPGPARAEQTCGETGGMDQMLEDVANAGAPAGVDAAAWGDKLAGLRGAWTALAEDCVGDGAGFEAKFATAHDAVHALLELLPMADK